MRLAVVLIMILGGAALTKADTIETISLDLSFLNPGSTLSGSFALPAAPASGDTAPVTLSFSDPSDYSLTSLTNTISLVPFLPGEFAVFFDLMDFTDLNGVAAMPGPTHITLTAPDTPAVCSASPCTSEGTFRILATGFNGHEEAFFSIAAVPEPRYALLLPLIFMAMILGRSLLIRKES